MLLWLLSLLCVGGGGKRVEGKCENGEREETEVGLREFFFPRSPFFHTFFSSSKKGDAPVSRPQTLSSSASSHISSTSSSSGSESAVTGAEGGSNGRERARGGATARAAGEEDSDGDRTEEEAFEVEVEVEVESFPPIVGRRQGTAREVEPELLLPSAAVGRLENVFEIIAWTIRARRAAGEVGQRR